MRTASTLAISVMAFSLAITAIAQSTPARYALVIGNGNYGQLGKLANPANDASDMAAVLKRLGFDAKLLIDADLTSMDAAVVSLGDKLAAQAGSIGFFYYAGHGVQSNGVNYLVPVDASIPSESFLGTRALAAQNVLDTLQAAKNGLNVIVLDACRDNPFGWSRSSSRGLSVVGGQPSGSILVYATSAGSVAQDGTGRNGVFTEKLLKNLQMPGLEIKDVFNRTGADVRDSTKGKQIPAVYNQFFDSTYLNEARQGSIRIVGMPAGSSAGIAKDGKPSNLADSGTFTALPIGSSWNVLVRSAYWPADFQTRVAITDDKDCLVSLPLGSLSFPAPPPGVACSVDGISFDAGNGRQGSTPALLAGLHTLKFTGDYIRPIERSASVSAGASTPVDLAFESVGRLALKEGTQGRLTTLTIDGQQADVAILASGIQVAAGDRRVHAESLGMRPFDALVTIKAGETVVFNPGFVQKTASLRLSGLPKGANVRIEGQGPAQSGGGDSSFVQQGLALGSYKVTASYPLWASPFVSTINLSEEKEYALAVETGWIEFPRPPEGATFSLNGRGFDPALAQDQLSTPPLIPGSYRLSIRRDYLKDWDATLMVEAGKAKIASGGYEEFGKLLVSGSSGQAYRIRSLTGAGPELTGMLGEGQGIPLSAGSYSIETRKSEDIDYSWKSSVEVPLRSTVSLRLPSEANDWSLAWRIQEENKQLASLKTAFEKTKSKRGSSLKIGTIGLVTGGLSGAAAGALYFLGIQAMADYHATKDSFALDAKRATVDLYGTLCLAGASLAGAGLGLGGLLLATAPNPAALEKQVNDSMRRLVQLQSDKAFRDADK